MRNCNDLDTRPRLWRGLLAWGLVLPAIVGAALSAAAIVAIFLVPRYGTEVTRLLGL